MREPSWGTKWTLHELDFGHGFGFGFALDWRSELRLAAGVAAFVRAAGFELRTSFTLLSEGGGGLGDDGGGLGIMLVLVMIGVWG
jgi:hypothetical protein